MHTITHENSVMASSTSAIDSFCCASFYANRMVVKYLIYYLLFIGICV